MHWNDHVTFGRGEIVILTIGVIGLSFSLGVGWGQFGASDNVIATTNKNATEATAGFSQLAHGQATLTDRLDRVITIICSGPHRDQRAGCGAKPTVQVVVKPVIEQVK